MNFLLLRRVTNMKLKNLLKTISVFCLLTFVAEIPVYANKSMPFGCPTGYTATTIYRMVLGPDGNFCIQEDRDCVLDPVVLTGGKFFLPVQDVKFPEPGTPSNSTLEFTRHYSNQDGFSGAFGNGWSSLLDLTLTFSMVMDGNIIRGGSVIVLRNENGMVIPFVLTKDTPRVAGRPIKFTDGQEELTWVPAPNPKFDTEGTISYKRPHGTTYKAELNPFVHFKSINKLNENRITIQYDAFGVMNRLTDRNGNSLSFQYGENKKVSRMSDQTGRAWRYSYDALGNLTQVVDWVGRVTRYTYADPIDPSNITTVIDPLGFKTAYAYNANDQVTKLTRPDGSTLTFSFDNLLGTSTMKDEHGKKWHYEYVKIGLVTLIADPTGGIWKYTYNPDTNLMTSMTNPRNRKTTYTYHADQNLRTITNSSGTQTFSGYEPQFNQWTRRTDQNGNITSRQFSARGNLLKETDHEGNITNYTYDSKGDIKTKTDPLGHVTSYTTNGGGFVTSRTDALGNKESFTYGARDKLLTYTDPKSQTTTFAYDAADNLIETILPDNSKIKMSYDRLDRPLSLTDPKGNMTSFAYSAPQGEDASCNTCSESNSSDSPKPTTITDPLGNITKLSYDPLGNLIALTDSNGNKSTYLYDSLSRLQQATNPLGQKTIFTYDKAGNLTKLQDPNGNITTNVYNASNHLTQTKDALDNITSFSYDNVGNLLKVTDANNNPLSFIYNKNYQKTGEKDALNNQTKFSYDKEGNLIQRIDANGKITSYLYNPIDDLLTIQYPDHKINYQYDPLGNLTQMTDKTGITKFTYDNRSRLTQALFPTNKSINYSYDSLNLLALSSEAGTIAYDYDIAGRLTKVISKDGPTSYTYDKAGRRTETLYPNQIKATYFYDQTDRLLSLTHNSLSNPTLKLPSSTYTYDNVGNRLSMKDNEGTHTYTYDNLYQLTSVTYPLGTKNEYTYDKVGNRLTLKEGTKTTAYTYDQANRLLKRDKSTYTYDKNGNTLKEQRPNKDFIYSYDLENRLTKVQKENKTINYTYDALGRRAKKAVVSGKTTNFYHDGFDVLFETNEKDKLKQSYVHGGRIDEILTSNGNTYLQDGLGSTTSLHNSQGQSQASYAYDAYGELRSQTGIVDNDFLYTGRQLDKEADLYYYRNRYYDPPTGRFITKDPIGLLGGINPYIYVNNNPTNYIDPYGNIALDAPISIAIGLAALYITNPEFRKAMETALERGVNRIKEISEEIASQCPLFTKNEEKSEEDSKKHTPEQEALVELAKEAAKNGANEEDAETLVEWGQEYGFPNSRGPESHPNRGEGGSQEHIHVGPINHIPVKRDEK